MGPYGNSPDSQTGSLSETYDALTSTLRRAPTSRQRLVIGMLRMKTDDWRRAIEASGLTHYRLAKMAGITPEVIDRFMSEDPDVRRDVRLETACKLATALGLELKPKSKRPKRKGSK
jgi:hypothetical protein